jgi:hypothetical protein
MRGGADKSLTRPTFRCRRTESWKTAGFRAKSIAGQLGISRERVGSIIHEDLDMRKVTKGGLVLARRCLGSPGTCNTEETGLTGLPMS